MKNVAPVIRNSRRFAILSVALTLGGIGGIAGGDVAADVLIPRESIGAPAGGGGGSADLSIEVSPVQEHREAVLAPAPEQAAVEWNYELPYEQGRPVVVDQAGTESAKQAAVEEAQQWPNFDSTSIALQPNTGSAMQAAVEDAALEAQRWPNFDSTSIALQPNAGLAHASEDVHYAIVAEQGVVYSPEMLETASTGETVASAQSNVQMVCPPCAIQV